MTTPSTVTHPGALVAAGWLDPQGLSVTEGAAILGVTRKTLSALLNGRQGISAEMSIRLSRVIDVAEDEFLKRQVAYDLSRVDRRAIHVVTPRRRKGGAK